MQTQRPYHQPGCSLAWREAFIEKLLALWNGSSGDDGASTGEQVVRVSCSQTSQFSGYADAQDHVLMRLETFIRHFVHHGTEKDPLLATASKLYLSQCCILSEANDHHVQIPELGALLMSALPDIEHRRRLSSAHLWMSAVETVSSTHYDEEDNILCVLQGEKQVALVSPEFTHSLTPSPLHSDFHHHAAADLFELAAGAGGANGRATSASSASSTSSVVAPVIMLTVKAGEGLFIPAGWWHNVHSSPKTIAVNFWYRPSSRAVSVVGGAADDEGDDTMRSCQVIGADAHPSPFVTARATIRLLMEEEVQRSRSELINAAIAAVGSASCSSDASALRDALLVSYKSFLSQRQQSSMTTSASEASARSLLLTAQPATGIAALLLLLQRNVDSYDNSVSDSEASMSASLRRPCAAIAWLFRCCLDAPSLDALSDAWEAVEGMQQVAAAVRAASGRRDDEGILPSDLESAFHAIWAAANDAVATAALAALASHASGRILTIEAFPSAIAAARESTARNVMQAVLGRLVGVPVQL